MVETGLSSSTSTAHMVSKTEVQFNSSPVPSVARRWESCVFRSHTNGNSGRDGGGKNLPRGGDWQEESADEPRHPRVCQHRQLHGQTHRLGRSHSE